MAMRLPLLAFALALGLAASASATTPAQMAFVERRGLLEADARCRLFTPDIRAALQAGAGQARSTLLREGWPRTRIDELETATVAAARARRCDDARTSQAAEQARSSFASWARTPSMTFPGRDRAWIARRFPDAAGWRLTQELPAAARIGVREIDGAQVFTLTIPSAAGQAAPNSAQVLLRDPARASADLLDLRGRAAQGLEAGAPSPASARSFWASARRSEAGAVSFTFPETAFQAMLALDPREAMEIRVQRGGATQRLLVEIGDVAAARTFLAIRAER
jgi:hypothetical protein